MKNDSAPVKSSATHSGSDPLPQADHALVALGKTLCAGGASDRGVEAEITLAVRRMLICAAIDNGVKVNRRLVTEEAHRIAKVLLPECKAHQISRPFAGVLRMRRAKAVKVA